MNDAQFKSGQNRLENKQLALLIRDILCRNLALNSLMVRPPSHLNSTSIKKRI